MRAAWIGFLLIVITSGCTRLQTFRVVDSQSGRPIEGVRVERLQSSIRPSPMPLVLYDNLTPVEKQITDGEGKTAFKESGSKVICNPSSRNPSFGRAYVTSNWKGVKICYPDEYREVNVKPVDGVVEVPLTSRRIAGRTSVEGEMKRDHFAEEFPEIRGREVMTRRE